MANNNFSGCCSPGCSPAFNSCAPCWGIQGPPGPPGPAGPSASVIPFSIDSVNTDGDRIATDEQGNPSIVDFAGFGGSTYFAIDLQPGDWANGTVTFTPSSSYGASFIMPYDGTLRKIFLLFANRGGGLNIPVGAIMRPFVSIATLAAHASQLVYNIIPETMTFTEPYIGTGEFIPKYSLRWGELENLNVPLPKGTAVAVMLGWLGENVTTEQQTNASISGGLFID